MFAQLLSINGYSPVLICLFVVLLVSPSTTLVLSLCRKAHYKAPFTRRLSKSVLLHSQLRSMHFLYIFLDRTLFTITKLCSHYYFYPLGMYNRTMNHSWFIIVFRICDGESFSQQRKAYGDEWK